MLIRSLLAIGIAGLPFVAHAEEVVVDMKRVSSAGVENSAGTITLKDTSAGLELRTNLRGLPAGERGFHVHENGDCSSKEKDGKLTAAQAAGGHYDPGKSGKHEGPHGKGHKGDLPKLVVKEDGTASETLVAEGLKLSEIKGRSIMIHAGGDNYSDAPEPLGGGGARIVCGVIGK